MCSVVGFLATGRQRMNVAAVRQKFGAVLHSASERGRDSHGVVALDCGGTWRAYRRLGPPQQKGGWLSLIDDDTSVVIANTRAEPTTEFVRHKTEHDIQPFVASSFVVSHNGTIANDAEIAQRYGLERTTAIDSAVLPHLFSIRGVAAGLQEVQGSFSIAAADRREPRVLHLARNFQPLVYQLDREAGVLWFASFADYLQAGCEDSLDPSLARVVDVPPYTHVRIDGTSGAIESTNLWQAAQPVPRRTLVVASGGLDSTVAASMLRHAGREIALLHMTYGCHAERRETEAVRQIARYLDCETIFINSAWLGELGASALTEDRTIASGHEGAELPHEWVPARNMVMIASACAVADARGYNAVALGTNLEEGGAYPDNTQEFIRIMSHASSLGTSARAIVEAPVGNLVKHEIVRVGLQVHAPLHLTWSCYRNGPLHCGECGPCFMRKTAFRMNGVPDPLSYLDDEVAVIASSRSAEAAQNV